MEQTIDNNREKVAIVTDSCADVPEELREKYQIKVLPMIISCQDGEYRDGIDIHVEDVYQRLKTELPKTSTPTGEAMEDLFVELKEQGYNKAIAIMLSGGLSGTANHMRLAVQESGLEISVIDSRSASIGCGVIVLQAAIWLEEGMSYCELCERLPKLCKDTKVFFSIDTLEYLQKGGRIGKAAAMVGTALGIKPILSFDEEGEIYTPAKVRGKKMVEKKLLALVEELVEADHTKRAYNLVVADGGAPEEREALEKRMRDLFPGYQNLFRAKIGAALSIYLGDGLLGAGIQFID